MSISLDPVARCVSNVSRPGRRWVKKVHMYDATEIFRTLPQHKKESYFKLAFYLFSFFYYLYRYVITPLPLPCGPLEQAVDIMMRRMVMALIAEGD